MSAWRSLVNLQSDQFFCFITTFPFFYFFLPSSSVLPRVELWWRRISKHSLPPPSEPHRFQFGRVGGIILRNFNSFFNHLLCYFYFQFPFTLILSSLFFFQLFFLHMFFIVHSYHYEMITIINPGNNSKFVSIKNKHSLHGIIVIITLGIW